VIKLSIPGWKTLEIHHVLSDLNGTLAVDGILVDGVVDKIKQLEKLITFTIITADTFGTAKQLIKEYDLTIHRMKTRNEYVYKATMVHQLGAEQTIFIGNGANDIAAFQEAALSICVIGGEGAYYEAVQQADLVVTSPLEALDLLLHPKRIVAGLRR